MLKIFKLAIPPILLVACWCALRAVPFGQSAPAGDQASAAADPDYLASKVLIRRDNYGVPHILGETEEAAAFGLGYAVAEDHILELARLFLKARSEEAAFFGEKFVDSDLATKELQIHEYAQIGYQRMPPWVRFIVDGYAAGYNRYVAKHRSELPEWVKPVSGVDVVAHARRVIIMEFSMDLRQLQAIGRSASASAPNVWWEPVHGSNMWAIGKERSVSGKGILLGNPHLSWSGSQIFHEAHLTVPGKVNISGSTLIGAPGLAIGFNENLGWSHTVNAHDSDDVYELTLDSKDEHRYLYDGHSLPMQKQEIEVRVKTDSGMVARKKDVYWTHYGPVLKWHAGKAYAFKSANLDECRFIEQWNRMGKAGNLAEFRRALDMQAIPMFNICYADREGNVFYIFNGRFPDRPSGYRWSGVIPGNTAASEWSSILPESRLPQLINPSGGYVQNSNSSPWYTNLRQIIDRRNFPEDLTPNFNGLRTQLSLEMLEADRSITLDEVLSYKYNTRLLLADRVKTDLLQIAAGQTVDGINLDEPSAVLQAWDNRAARESRSAMLFVTFWTKYREKARPLFAKSWEERQPVTTPAGIGDKAAALKALAAAAKEMKEKYHVLDPPWGDIHRLRRGSLDVPIGGLTDDFGAFRIIGYEPLKDGIFAARGGDSYVFAVEFTSPPKAYSIVAYSQSDDQNSRHYTDQSALFAQEKWKQAWFTEDEIAKNLERSYRP
ncbi:MAG TPA: acylase [Acidobacteriota bacterium]|jgi:acyl-homoserine-lactone acylase